MNTLEIGLLLNQALIEALKEREFDTVHFHDLGEPTQKAITVLTKDNRGEFRMIKITIDEMYI
jgi:hypothetical protein